MPDYTRGDDPVYNGFRDSWNDQHETDAEIDEIIADIPLDRLREICDAEREKVRIKAEFDRTASEWMDLHKEETTDEQQGV